MSVPVRGVRRVGAASAPASLARAAALSVVALSVVASVVLALVVLALVVAVPFAAAPARAAAAAQTDEWEIRSFQSVIEVDPDGSLLVTETIEVTFHQSRRGIYREIPFRYPYDARNRRVLDIDLIEVRTSPGTPSFTHEERSGDFHVWRVGDERHYIRGDHTYTFVYRVRGALNRFDSHDELFWNATGDRWEVPIPRVSVEVRVPDAEGGAPAIRDVRCFAGATGGTDPCDGADATGAVATFRHGELPPGTQLDVVVAITPGLVDVEPPMLEPSNLLARVFRVDPLRVAGAVWVTGMGLIAVVALFRRGRDEPAAPVAGALPGGVEYRPPDDLRPAQLRTLITERVDKVSLSATLVDLAVRGYVRIEETEPARGKPDWIIHRRADASPEGLEDYEREVLSGLFKDGRDAVKVSALSGTFFRHYQAASRMLYRDVVRRGFYRFPPNWVRTAAIVVAAAVTLLGFCGLANVISEQRTIGLIVAPVPVIGVLLLVAAWRAPRRTAVGAAVYRRARGFREFIRTAEADRMAFAERERIFASYLPYAIAFECVRQWVQVFSKLGVAPAAAVGGWYVGHSAFNPHSFGSAMTSLGSQVGGAMSHAPAASRGSSGFSGGSSGGGMGGGGGGSW